MIKKIFFSMFFLIFLAGTSFAAGSSDSSSKETLYDKAVQQIKMAKKLILSTFSTTTLAQRNMRKLSIFRIDIISLSTRNIDSKTKKSE